MPINLSPAALDRYLANLPAETAPAPVVAPSSPPSLSGPIAALLAGNTGDAASTWYALSHNPNAREGNPLLPNNGALIAAIKLLASIPEVYAVKQLRDHGHPTAAKALGYGLGALGGGMTVNNLVQARR